MALGPVILGYAYAARQRGDHAPAARRHHVHAAAPARGRGRRADRRARARAPSACASARPAPTPRAPRSAWRARSPGATACSSAATTAGTTGTSATTDARPRRPGGGPGADRRVRLQRPRVARGRARAPRRRDRRRDPRADRRSTSPRPGYLEARRPSCTRGAARSLVFDEIITGFRVALGGAQERYGVAPDLACFGKALGNGMPISARRRPRRASWTCCEDVFFSGTHGGEALSLAAAARDARRLDRGRLRPPRRQGRAAARGRARADRRATASATG